jgi:hypothetical protein
MEKKHTTPDNRIESAAEIKGAGSKATKDARTEAGNDMDKDPDTFARPAEEDDLDEGELARKDNSND